VEKIQTNYQRFAGRLKDAGYNLLHTETAIVPVVCGSTPSAAALAKHCQDNGIFVQAIVAPVVPEGLARLRTCVSAAHTVEDLDYCADVIIDGGRKLGIIA
jgi:7-keto-8-aminopelargonate synthetase-like enzyme